MNPLMKKIATGTLAAGLLVGGTGVYYSQAFAATDSSAAAVDNQGSAKTPGAKGSEQGGRGQRGGIKHGGGLVEQTAALLGIESSVIREELMQQKTLAQIAQEKGSLSQEALLQKLVEAETAKVTELITAGKLTQTQADEKIAGLSERIQKEITAVAGQGAGKGGLLGGQHGKGGFPGGGKGGFGHFGNPETVSGLIGLTKDELTAALKEGKTLTEIAAEKGIDKEQLVSKIKDSLDESIRQFVDRKQTDAQRPAPAADAAAEGTSATGA
ncbi:hypothetical protein [Paenibacillus puerhi]|uniref:hypothetical protein n=1 Tax=Paenibacillus puerhi TaxID=2692622 RepID=UPI00135B8A4E|nr:hypothetical protein [Paenibacillus puerhi]